MSKIYLKLEVQNHIGNVVKVFSKEVESDHTPSKDMIFAGEDYTIEVRGIYFNVDDGSVFVRFVETPNEDEINGWDFLIEEGWEQL